MSNETNHQPSSHRPTSQALRLSLLLPVAITLAIWVVGAVVLVIFPLQFNAILGYLIGISLGVYLFYWTRKERLALRITAILFALPALLGISFGTINGNLTYTLAGLAVTVVLLALQRFLNTPISYRTAYRYFTQGNYTDALELVNKSIAARPDFWQSYQLRALIHLMQLNLDHAERDAQHAVALNPAAHPVYNTMGQVYLAQNRFADAESAYAQALEQAPEYALYNFHLGLSRFRQEKYETAAAALAAATRGTLPLDEYDLQTYYYLGYSLAKMGEEEKSAEAFATMHRFGESLQTLRQQLAQQPDYPHVQLMQADLQEIKSLLEEKVHSENDAKSL